jgi:hypothetical protein
VQGYVRAVRAVCIQDTPDDGEEVTDSAFLKSRSNCGRTFPFTELFTANMWMCDFLVCGSRIWFQGNHEVRTAVVQLVELVQFQLNLERTQIDILQSDWLCDNGDVIFGCIELDIAKFLLESI